jgi:hypothetical protein
VDLRRFIRCAICTAIAQHLSSSNLHSFTSGSESSANRSRSAIAGSAESFPDIVIAPPPRRSRRTRPTLCLHAIVPVLTLLTSSSSPSLGPAPLLPATLHELLPVLDEPPASELPRVCLEGASRRRRSGARVLSGDCLDSRLHFILMGHMGGLLVTGKSI